MTMRLRHLKNYSTWLSLNESAAPDAQYVTFEFPSDLDLTKNVEESIRNFFSTLDGVKLEKVTETTEYYSKKIKVEVSLVEEEGFGFFGELGIAENITFDISLFNEDATKRILLSVITKKLDVLKSNKLRTKYYCVLPDSLKEEDDSALFDFIFNSDELISQIDKAQGRTWQNIEYSVPTSSEIESALLDTDPASRKKKIDKLNHCLSISIARQAFRDKIRENTKITKENVYLDDYSQKIESMYNEFAQHAKSADQLSKEEKMDLFAKIIGFEKYLAKTINPRFIQSKKSVTFLKKTQILLYNLGYEDLTPAEKDSLTKQ